MTDLKIVDAHGDERIVPNAEVEHFTGKFNGEVLRPADPGVRRCPNSLERHDR